MGTPIDTAVWSQCTESVDTLLSLLESMLTRGGNHPRLEKLSLSAQWKGVEIFRDAPRLTELVFGGEFDPLPNLPWSQIVKLTYGGQLSIPSGSLSILLLTTNLMTANFC